MLKTLIGIVVSGNSQNKQNERIIWEPNSFLLNLLFGIETFPAKWGLYINANVGHPSIDSEVNSSNFGFAPLANESTVYGAIMSLKFLSFILVLADPPRQLEGTVLHNYLYRPSDVTVRASSVLKNLKIFWDGESSENGILVDIDYRTYANK